MSNKINSILKEVLKRVNPSEEELNSIGKFLKGFILKLERELKRTKTSAEVFVGGSFAKKTMIRKGQYDIDVFIRFDEKYKGKDISELTEKTLKRMKIRTIKIHGSREYFRLNASSGFFIEVIPVLKVRVPKSAENITDLSYFHVNYIRKRIKTEKMLEQIRLAKAFCHANKCYGAESYISGFSGYALELLVYYYKSFLGFLKGMAKIKEKEIIDIEKLYKNKQEVMMNMNSAKMSSPIVLIDPTYKERNALAALSAETFEGFKEACRSFLKKPSLSGFEIKEVNLGSIKKSAERRKEEFILLRAETNKQEGDIAGSKLLKFYRHFAGELEKRYKISNKGFNYNGKKEGEYFFVARKKPEIIIQGPHLRDSENVRVFRKHHKKTFVKNSRVYAREKIEKGIRQFVMSWKLKNSDKMKAMHITNLDIINL